MRRCGAGDFVSMSMDIDLIFKIAAIGIIVSILNQVLSRSGREEQATMTSLAGLVVVLMMVSYAFPLISQFRNDTKSVLKNALIFSVAYLPRTALIVVVNVFPWALLLTNLYMFLQVGFIWVVVYFAAAAYINTRLLKKVFTPYMEPDEEEK